MSVLGSMATGISGMRAMGTNLSIIGDNIANAQTTGFKASRGEFQDVIATNLKGILGGNQIGRGTHLNAVTTLHEAGNITPTERDSDMAIRGNGFFVLRDHHGSVSFTRDGSFRFDEKGRLTTSDGAKIQGYRVNPDNEKVDAELSDVEFTSNTIPARGTEQVRINANMDVRKPINPNAFDPVNPDKNADFNTAIRVYDTAGSSHSINVFFHKTGDYEWTWHGMADGAELQEGQEGVLQEIASGKLTFTPDGKLATDELLSSNISFKGAQADQKIDFFFGDSIITRNGTGLAGTTHYGSDSQVFKQVQDGYAAGTLSNFSIDEKGMVSGSYSNGVTRPLAYIALGRFENNEGLYKLGQNRYKEAVKSGQPLIGRAGEAGRGEILAKSLEASNVDLASEFVQMIQTQRNFQANSKTISTSDELLQDIINLKR